jgi:hypothetical protein
MMQMGDSLNGQLLYMSTLLVATAAFLDWVWVWVEESLLERSAWVDSLPLVWAGYREDCFPVLQRVCLCKESGEDEGIRFVGDESSGLRIQ